jgi:MFS family permease
VCLLPVGFSLAFGVLQEYYTSHPHLLSGNTKLIPIIGTTATGILYLCSPFTFSILSRHPRLRSLCGPVGLVLAAGALQLSTTTTSLEVMLLTQGVLHGLGCGLLFAPTTLYLDEWFVRRKGTAYGVMWGAKSLNGGILPFAMNFLLRALGWKNALRIWGATMFVLSAPLLYFLKPRVPVSPTTRVRKLDTRFLRERVFWMLQMGNIFQSLGYFLPSTYLSSYAVSSLHLSPIVGTTTIAVFGATSVAGNIVIGVLDDFFPIRTVLLLSSLGSAFSVFFLWGFSAQLSLLVLFAIAYGFFAGGYSSTWSGIQKRMRQESASIDTGFVFGLIAGGRGLGFVLSGPLSVALLSKDNWLESGKSWGFNTKFGPVILFTGVTALLGGWGCLERLKS